MANENELEPKPVLELEKIKTAIEMEKEIDADVILKHLTRNDGEVE